MDSVETAKELATLQANVIQSQKDVSEIKGDVKGIKATLESVVANQIKMDGVFVTQSQYKADKESDKKTDFVRNVGSALLGALLTGMVALIVYLMLGQIK